MTNHILNFAKSFQVHHQANICIMIALSCVCTLTVIPRAYAADTVTESQTTATGSHYKVPESIPIDRLIQKLYANSPLNTAVLRKVLTDANPKIITGNPQQRVKSGTAIVVPDHGEVVKSTLTPYLVTTQETSDNNPAARDYQARKHWVRFP